MTIPQSYWDKILPKAQALGEAVANHEFVVMLNPKYRGPNWTWDKFVPRCVGQAEVTAWQSFTDREWKRWEKEIVGAAVNAAEHAAKRILEESGLLEWWPDPTKKPAPVPPNEEHEELSEARLATLLDAERENTALRQQVAELTALGVSLHKAAAAGRDEERAAVVAWLRERQEAVEWALTAAGYEHAADTIERGEHRREEEPE